ncbi:hypothetical protein [Solihabitans fulvus]|uniref:hypothetical protein n=1 Tax=Solihabitans fulvus TaxID=1892852 RepID=UPI001661F3D3|nr:hypothetical protein [Solihabitans fulvus]
MSTELHSKVPVSARRRRRVTLLGAVVATTGVLLAGCGSGPSQIGAAAIVGDTVIPVDVIQQQIDSYVAKEPQGQQELQQHKLDQQSRTIVAQRVLHELTQIAAKREGINVNDADVTKLIDDNGGADAIAKGRTFDAAAVPGVVRDQLVREALGLKYLTKLSVVVDYTSAASPGEAQDKAKKIAADPAKMAEIVKADASSAATQQGFGARLGTSVTAAQIAQIAQNSQTGQDGQDMSPLLGVRPGTVVAFAPSQQNAGWIVAYVRKRDTNSTVDMSTVSKQLDPERAGLIIGTRVLQSLADDIGVRINPRYGVWDSGALALAHSDEEKTVVVLPPVRTMAP